jgi:hypothetical protein
MNAIVHDLLTKVQLGERVEAVDLVYTSHAKPSDGSARAFVNAGGGGQGWGVDRIWCSLEV